MEKYLLGIDYGTGGVKCTIINASGIERSYAFEEYPIITSNPGWLEHNAVNYWSSACRIIKKAVMEAGMTGARFGDAILAGVATGIFKDFSVAKKWTEYIEPMQPDQKNHETYMQYFNLYKDLYLHIKGDYQVLANLRNKSNNK